LREPDFRRICAACMVTLQEIRLCDGLPRGHRMGSITGPGISGLRGYGSN
jgi:hypothetical protein